MMKDLQDVFSLESGREKGDGCILCSLRGLLVGIVCHSVQGHTACQNCH